MTIQRDNQAEEVRGSFAEMLADLRVAVPDDLIKTRQTTKIGDDADYVEWTIVQDILDRKAPRWSFKIVSTEVIEALKQVVVTVSITIDGVTREDMGIAQLSELSYGGPVYKAKQRGLKRAACAFGINRSMYQDADVQQILDNHEARQADERLQIEEERRQLETEIQGMKCMATSAGINYEQLIAGLATEYPEQNIQSLYDLTQMQRQRVKRILQKKSEKAS